MSGFLKKWAAANTVATLTSEPLNADAVYGAVRDTAASPALLAGSAKPQDDATPRHEAVFANAVRVEIFADDQGRWYMAVRRGWSREMVKNFCTPFAAHGARTAEMWFGAPVTPWQPEICE